jgi:uncharacterized protein YndB with AHSA1/START domain
MEGKVSEHSDPSIVECEIFVAAAPEKIFPFLVEPELMKRWIGISHVSNPRQPDPYSIALASGSVARGFYTAVSPPHRNAFTWGWEGPDAFPPGTSLVEIELVPKDGGTLVRLRHSGLPETVLPLFSPANHREHWLQYLARLGAVIGFQS